MTNPANKGKSAVLDWIKFHLSHQGKRCLIWPFSLNTNGYGHLKLPGSVNKTVYAHRIMCQLAHGDPPTPEHEAAHSCGNGHAGCVNPLHLSWKTTSENGLERRQHGTVPRNNKPKLTLAQRTEIRALKGIKSQPEIAAIYGITPHYVSYIQSRDANHAWRDPAEGERLRERFQQVGLDLEKLAKEFGRTQVSIRARLYRLGLAGPRKTF